jgi:F-type H+-transporting ATPase subunit b
MLLTPHAGLIIWTIVTFIVVLLVLKRTVWKPLLGALDEREARIRDAIEGADQARQDAQSTLEEHQRLLAGAEAETKQILAEAREAAEKVRAGIVEGARSESQQIVEQARRTIESEKTAALSQLRRDVADLAVQAAGIIIDANMDGDSNRKLVDDLISQVPQA